MSGGSSVMARTSADDNKVFCCTVCYRFEVPAYESWLWHLGSREHHVALSKSPILNSWRKPNFRPKCVYISGILGLDSREVLDYFKSWGEIEDFYYPFVNKGDQKKARGCLCLFREKESVQILLKEDVHIINDKTVQVRMKGDVSFAMEDKLYEEQDHGYGRKRKSDELDRDSDNFGGKRQRYDNHGERRFSY